MKWISVNDELPAAGDEVLVWEKWSKTPFVGWLNPHSQWIADKDFVECDGDCVIVSAIQQELVTHWMPLPTAPEVEE